VREDEVLETNHFRKVRKITNKMPCNLIFATFDDFEDRKKLDKFL